MQKITHEEQRERWEKEHKKPQVLLQMDSHEPSSGVIKFADWLTSNGQNLQDLAGVEMCCGKGRSVIWLAKHCAHMTGLDYSQSAIAEAKRRAKAAGVAANTTFFVQDVTKKFAIPDESQDFAIDCFGSTDIESEAGRKAARDSLIASLRPNGYLLVYLLSTDDQFHKKMIQESPGPDEGSFIHPINCKYEKAFTEEEVRVFYRELKLITLERIPKTAVFFNEKYDCNHIWAVFQKS